MEEQEGIDFLLVEYGKTLDLIQHYDNIRVSLLRFAASYHSVVGTVAFAIYRYLYHNDRQSNNMESAVPIFLGCLLIVAFLIGIASVAMLAQNRRYFVITARQANTIRGVLFKRGSLASSIKSVFPANPDEPKVFNPKSTHLVTIFLLEIVNSISFSFSILFFIMTTNLSVIPYYYFIPLTCGLTVFIGQFFLIKHVFLKELS